MAVSHGERLATIEATSEVHGRALDRIESIVIVIRDDLIGRRARVRLYLVAAPLLVATGALLVSAIRLIQ